MPGLLILVIGAVVVIFLLNQKPPEQFDPVKDIIKSALPALKEGLQDLGHAAGDVYSGGKTVVKDAYGGVKTAVKDIYNADKQIVMAPLTIAKSGGTILKTAGGAVKGAVSTVGSLLGF